MAKKKYEGLYLPSSLKPLIDKGDVYVECAHCGAQIDNWVIIMSKKCPGCGQDHGIIELIYAAKKQEEIEQANTIVRQYEFVRNILVSNLGCVYTATNRTVNSYTGEAAFLQFVNIVQNSRNYTCLRCPLCGFIHIVELLYPGDIFAGGSVYLIKRRVGLNGPDNWQGSFTCLKCNQSSRAHARLSYEIHPRGREMTKGDPFFFIPRSKRGVAEPTLLSRLFRDRKTNGK